MLHQLESLWSITIAKGPPATTIAKGETFLCGCEDIAKERLIHFFPESVYYEEIKREPKSS
jgi:hypothetical protein